MKYVFLVWALYVSLNAYSQDCSPASLSQKPGIWKEGMKGSVSGIPAADLEKERKVVASLHSLIKSKYSPLGVEADFNGSFDRPDAEIPVNDYDYKIYFMPYFCEKNIIKTAHETSTTFSISSNRFNGNIYEIADESNIPEGYYSLKNMPVEKDGYFYFEEKASLGFGETGKSRNWLITLDGKLPYSYVTKKEFLETQKKMLMTAMPKAIENSNASYKLNTEKSYKNALTKLETLLKMPSGESEQPAIVKQDPADYLSYIFTNANDPFCKVLIKPNPGYFNSKLTRSSPQFFLVNVTGNENDQVAGKVMNDLMKDFDFTSLKNILGK